MTPPLVNFPDDFVEVTVRFETPLGPKPERDTIRIVDEDAYLRQAYDKFDRIDSSKRYPKWVKIESLFPSEETDNDESYGEEDSEEEMETDSELEKEEEEEPENMEE